MLVRWMVHNWMRSAAESAVRDGIQRTMDASDDIEVASTEALTQCRIAVVCASPLEATGLVDLMGDVITTRCATFIEHVGLIDDVPVVIVESSDQAEQIQQAVEDVIAMYPVDWVIAAGFATGLADGIGRDDIIMPQTLVAADHAQINVGFSISEDVLGRTRGLHTGKLASVAEVIRDEEGRRATAAEFGAIAADMESYWIAKSCQALKKRLMVVRVVSEAVGDKLPELVENVLNQDSTAGKLGAATRAVFSKLSNVKEMWKLKSGAYQASDRLAKYLVGVIAQLR